MVTIEFLLVSGSSAGLEAGRASGEWDTRRSWQSNADFTNHWGHHLSLNPLQSLAHLTGLRAGSSDEFPGSGRGIQRPFSRALRETLRRVHPVTFPQSRQGTFLEAHGWNVRPKESRPVPRRFAMKLRELMD
ncbi:hypothetical protein BQ8482_111817 [Mesorhizobium delmotii]|uniref:Uncharacterized protein n=1 Tax=Mesorhizobium delmotii TaxID=1631247 RepID=A0A2P9AFH7_9HYPH|nr:hypothetical protein BQ8482_111817 [Mesorhizobium delmotii]